MEKHKKCDHIRRFYFVNFRPSYKLEKKEADKQYGLSTLAQSRIKKEIDQRLADERQIHKKIMWFSQCDEHIDWRKDEIKRLEAYLVEPEPRLPMNSVAIITGFVCLTGEKDGQWDRKRCQKRLIKKYRMDIEYLEQVQEELMSSKKSIGMTLCGTHHLIKSMEHGLRHWNKKSEADEMKIFREIRNVKETREVYNAREPDPPSYCHWYQRERLSKSDIDSDRLIQHDINIRLEDIEIMERGLRGRKRRVTRLKSELEFVRRNISCLEKELQDATSKSLKAYERVYELGEQKKELIQKSDYKEYQFLIANAKSLAEKRGFMGLKQASDTQVEGFMKQWNDSKVFRNNYEQKKLLYKGSKDIVI